MSERKKISMLIRPSVEGPQVLPIAQSGGPGSGQPAPYLVATGQSGQAVIGIDFGSHFVRTAMYEHGQLQKVTNDIPNRVTLVDNGTVHTSQSAETDSSKLVVSGYLPFVGSSWDLDKFGQSFLADDLCEFAFKNVKQICEARIELPVSKAVVSVPASFSAWQRKIVREACEKSGVEVLQVINTPTAVGLHYLFCRPETRGNYMVVSMGAGAFSASVVKFAEGIAEVKYTSGDSQLGGTTIDNEILQWLTTKFAEEIGYRPLGTYSNIALFRNAAHRAKLDLSMAEQAWVILNKISVEMPEGVVPGDDIFLRNFSKALTRLDFECILSSVLAEIEGHIDECLVESGLDAEEIKGVLLVGESLKLGPIKDLLRERFAYGIMQELPASNTAFGAALQASLLTRDLQSFVAWDVLTTPVGIELEDNRIGTVIAKGTPLPVTGYRSTVPSGGTVNVHVIQGDSSFADENLSVAELTINNCPPCAGDARVEISFCVQADGSIEFRARHTGLGINLPVHVGEGLRKNVVADLTGAKSRRANAGNEDRLRRLSRKLGVSPQDALKLLRLQQYSTEDIESGRAVEDFLKRVQKAR
jgi:molecular chaperone DnaK